MSSTNNNYTITIKQLQEFLAKNKLEIGFEISRHIVNPSATIFKKIIRLHKCYWLFTKIMLYIYNIKEISVYFG